LLVPAAPGFAVEVAATPVRQLDEIDVAMAQWERESDYGLIVPSDPSTNSQRKFFLELAARHRMPAIFALRAATADGRWLRPDVARSAFDWLIRCAGNRPRIAISTATAKTGIAYHRYPGEGAEPKKIAPAF
jgi:hypothetical protein